MLHEVSSDPKFGQSAATLELYKARNKIFSKHMGIVFFIIVHKNINLSTRTYPSFVQSVVTIAACELEQKERDKIQFLHTQLIENKVKVSILVGHNPHPAVSTSTLTLGERRNRQVSFGEKGVEEYQEKSPFQVVFSPQYVLPSQR